MNEQYQKDLKQEQDEFKAFRRALKAFIGKCGPMQKYGDGDCAFIVHELMNGLTNAGLYSGPSSLPSASMKKKAIGNTLRTKVFERDAYRCKHCGTHENLRADHVHPESKGGPTTFENLQTLCASCNSKKGVSL